jgi:hypothetical protein
MAVMGRLAAAFAMTDPVWERHANPWSGLTRMPVLPLAALAIFSRVWIGWWCLIPLALLVVWTWINPRAFGPPLSTRGWMSRAVMGERVWLNAAVVPIPRHHSRAAAWLSIMPVIGLAPMIWGLWVLDPWASALGVVLTLIVKLWFLDRMVWLFDDMAVHHPPYAAWLR